MIRHWKLLLNSRRVFLYQTCSEKSRIIFVSPCKGDYVNGSVSSMVAVGDSDHAKIRVEDIFSVSPVGSPVVYDEPHHNISSLVTAVGYVFGEPP